MLKSVFNFYSSAWRSSVASSTGRRLWLLLIIKICVLLILFKILFFPNILATDYDSDEERASAVRENLELNIND